MKNLGNCAVCGLPITNAHCTKYCGNACYKSQRNSKTLIVKCEFCGTDIKQIGSDIRRFCSAKCSSESRKNKAIVNSLSKKTQGINRPYTAETRYLIRLWTKQGDSKADIALMMNRSLESVELAFN